jgi:hypothetical protein
MIQWQVRVQGEIDRVRMNYADPTAWPPALEATAQAREADTATAQQYLTSYEDIVLALRQQLNFEMVRIWQGPAAEARFRSFDPQNQALERGRSELIDLRRETTALQDISRAMRAGASLPYPFV